MVECRDCARFLFEPFAMLSRQPLDRDRPIEARVACAVDLTHPARAEESDDLVGAEVRTRSEGQTVGLYRRSHRSDGLVLDNAEVAAQRSSAGITLPFATGQDLSGSDVHDDTCDLFLGHTGATPPLARS
jgi:hypothetical protein